MLSEKGSILANKYRIISLIKETPRGRVYLAEDLQLSNLKYVIKEMKAPEDSDKIKENYLKASKLMKLNTPFLPRVLDFWVKSPFQYLVLEYVEGEKLSELFTTFSLTQVINVVKKVISLGYYLYRERLEKEVMVDLNPENIVITRDGELKFLDFGIPAKSKTTFYSLFIRSLSNTKWQIDNDFKAIGAFFFYLVTGGKKLKDFSITSLPPKLREFTEKAFKGEFSSLKEMEASLDKLPLPSPFLQAIKWIFLIIAILAIFIGERLCRYKPPAFNEEQIMFMRPSFSKSLKDWGVYYYRKQDYLRAKTFLKKHFLLNPTDGEALIYLNNCNNYLTKLPLWKIGVVAPITGERHQDGEAMLQGVSLAQQELSYAGVRVNVELADDCSNTSKAKIAAELLSSMNVLGVIGNITSACTLASAPVYSQNRLVLISPTATSVKLQKAGDYIFSVCPSDEIQGEALARVASTVLKSNGAVVVYNPKDPYSQDLACAFCNYATKENLKIVKKVDFKDFNINNIEFDLLFLSGYDKEALEVIKKLNKKGKINILGGDALYTQRFLQLGGESVEGVYCTAFFHPSLDEPAVQDFVRVFKRTFGGGMPQAVSAQSYDATKVLCLSIIRSKGKRDKIKEELRKIGSIYPAYKGVTGEVRFWGDNSLKPWILLKVFNGQFHPVRKIVP